MSGFSGSASVDVDVSAYLARIGFDHASPDSSRPTLETLTEIQRCHMASICFENLDIVIGRKISIVSSDVTSKLVASNRGGYCFEHSTLLLQVLRAMGYTASPMLARVRWKRPPGSVTAYTHIVLVVGIPSGQDEGEDGGSGSGSGSVSGSGSGSSLEYLVDVGFGGIGSTAPLCINIDTPQYTEATYRIGSTTIGGVCYSLVQWYLDDAWQDMYSFRNEAVPPIDLEMSNWWSCTYPMARWCTCMFIARVVGGNRHYILNSEYSVRKADGTVARVTIVSIDMLNSLLATVFNVSFPLLGEEHKRARDCCQRYLDLPPAM
jgi:N-hydroxyarylamine O-acetyltransferase